MQLKKYGKENFSVDIIDTADSDEELNCKEEYYIDLYNAVKSENYYNLRRGGSRGPGGPMFAGHTHTEETKKKMSEDRKGKNNANYGNHWKMSDECKKLHSILSSGKNNGMYGKKHSKETKDLISQQLCGRRWINNGNEQKYIQPEHINQFLEQGWVFGMLPKNIKTKSNCKESATTIES